jgi:hypothetical protein
VNDQIAISGWFNQNARSGQGYALRKRAIHCDQAEPVIVLAAKQVEARQRLFGTMHGDADARRRRQDIRILMSTFECGECNAHK